MTVSRDRSPELTGPLVRPRRLRRTPALRRLVAETPVDAAPAGAAAVRPRGHRRAACRSRRCPGVVQHTRDSLLKAVAEAADLGLGGVMLFGIPEHKDAVGSGASTRTASSTSRSPTWSPRSATRSR